MNQHGKFSKITFDIVQKIIVIIGTNNVLKAGFSSDLKDDKSSEDERKGNSVKILKTNIKLALKNKRKSKCEKQILGQIKNPSTKKITKTNILPPKLGKL